MVRRPAPPTASASWRSTSTRATGWCGSSVSVGTLTASLVHPREVLGPALRARAAALVVAHNHPSGDPEPSPEDCALTERLRDAARLLGLELLDHVVVGRNGFVSLRERGVL